MSKGPKSGKHDTSAVMDAVVCGTDTSGAIYATNHCALENVEDHAYCTGCIGCVEVLGDVPMTTMVDESDPVVVAENPTGKFTECKKSDGPNHMHIVSPEDKFAKLACKFKFVGFKCCRCQGGGKYDALSRRNENYFTCTSVTDLVTCNMGHVAAEGDHWCVCVSDHGMSLTFWSAL